MSRFGQYWKKFKTFIPPFHQGSPARTAAVEFVLVYTGAYLFTSNVYGVTVCVGPSMIPTFHEGGELAIIDRISYKFNLAEYKVGDVVISQGVDDPSISKTQLSV
jgi:signal peptidase I